MRLTRIQALRCLLSHRRSPALACAAAVSLPLLCASV